MLSHQLKSQHILVNAVWIGWTNTDMGKEDQLVKGPKGLYGQRL